MNIYTIYKATCKKTGKIYIGYDSKWPKRRYEHKQSMKDGDQVFYRALRKYGWFSFIWEVLYQSKDAEHTLKEMEPFFIRENLSYIHYTNSNGYNMTEGGEGTIGHKHSTKTKTLISKILTGKTKGRKKGPRTLSHRVNLKRALIGRTPWNKGKTTGQVPWNKGKTGVYSEDTLDRMRTNSGKHAIGKKWYNDGSTDYHIFPEEALPHYMEGRYYRKRVMKVRVCPHCGYEGSGGNMTRFHFEGCDYNPNKKRDP